MGALVWMEIGHHGAAATEAFKRTQSKNWGEG